MDHLWKRTMQLKAAKQMVGFARNACQSAFAPADSAALKRSCGHWESKLILAAKGDPGLAPSGYGHRQIPVGRQHRQKALKHTHLQSIASVRKGNEVITKAVLTVLTVVNLSTSAFFSDRQERLLTDRVDHCRLFGAFNLERGGNC
jgi:hypothetical protein